VVAAWVLSDCDSILSVEINCVKRTYSEVTGKLSNVNKDNILDLDLD
jgi:hypothetical protein